MASDTVQGRRAESHDDFFEGEPGAYMTTLIEEHGKSRSRWFVRPPCGHYFFLADNPRAAVHEVDEHDDGTISVVPKPGNSNSILCVCGWHGYLEHGVWRPV